MSGNEFTGKPGLDRVLIEAILFAIDRLGDVELDLTDFAIPAGHVTPPALAGLTTIKLLQLLHRVYTFAEDAQPDILRQTFPTNIGQYGRGDGRRPQYTSRFSHQDIADRSG